MQSNIYSRLNFKNHVNHSCQKAANVVNALARIMPNIGGPRYSRRILLSHVEDPALWVTNVRKYSERAAIMFSMDIVTYHWKQV